MRGVPVDYVTAESRAYGPSVNQTLATEWHHTIVDSPVRRWTWRIAADLLSQTKNNLCAPSFHSQGDRFSQAEDCFTSQTRVTKPGTNRGEVSPSTGFRRVIAVTSYPVIPITPGSRPLQTAHFNALRREAEAPYTLWHALCSFVLAASSTQRIH